MKTNTLLQNSLKLPEKALDELSQHGYTLLDDLIPLDLCEELLHSLVKNAQSGRLHQAKIGKGLQQQTQAQIRGDLTLWLSQEDSTLSHQIFLKHLAAMMHELNHSFFLNIDHYEAHFALYPPGHGYDKHIDQAPGSRSRLVTFILYLNKNWQNNDGGELVLYKPDQPEQELTRIAPVFARMVLFRSELFPHQVLPAHFERKSLTGWFRTSH